MTKIVDPDQLTQGVEVFFSSSTKEIHLFISGNLNDSSPGKSSGVTHQALYSFAKEEWLATANLQKIRFPFDPIFEAKFDWINNWKPKNQQTIDLIRDGGFRVVLQDKEYAAIISLGDMDNPNADQAYYWQLQGLTSSVSNFDKTGEVNEPILIYNANNPNYRNFLKVALREQGKLYDEGNLLADQDLASLTYQAYRLPLVNSPDINIVATDNTIDTTTPYMSMSLNFIQGRGGWTYSNSTPYASGTFVHDPNVQVSGSAAGSWWYTVNGGITNGANTGVDAGVVWEPFAGQEQIGIEWYAFNRILHSYSGSKEEIYEWAMRQLRKTGNINSNLVGAANQDDFGNVNGKTARLLVDFIGSQLVTQPGVLIRYFDPNDTNSLTFRDITAVASGSADVLDEDWVPTVTTERNFPFVAAGTLVFSDNLVNEPNVDTIYKMFFQYTTRETGTDVAMTSVATNTGTLTSSTTNFTTHFSNGNYVLISGFANSVNNGLYQVDGTVTSTSMPVRKVNGATLINEAAGPTVNLDADPYDSPDAIVVNDNAGSPITGQITAGSINFTFDYDGNAQGGRTPATDAPIAVVAQGTAGAQWVDGLFTITAQTGLSFPLNAATERVYSNP
jgi:hypothetical protein